MSAERLEEGKPVADNGEQEWRRHDEKIPAASTAHQPARERSRQMSHEGQSAFYSEARLFFDEQMQDSPPNATFIGDHRFDDRLSSLAPEALADQRRRLGAWREKFAALPVEGWSMDARIDLTLVIQFIKNIIRAFDALRLFQRDPSFAANECLNGIYFLIIRDFAPLSQRMRSALGRLRQVRRVLAEGRALIVPSEVPLVWAEIALDTARQGAGLFNGLLPAVAKDVPELEAELTAASGQAAAELGQYAEWLQREVVPNAAGQYAVGRKLFDEILREDHMVGYDAAELLKTGWKLYQDTERRLTQVGRAIDPAKTVLELLEESKRNHPKSGELLDVYRRWMADARRFVIERQIATIPQRESIRVEPTPAFMRPLIPYAAYMMPGFFEPSQPGIFLVTPVDEGADPEAAERKLRGHPSADLPITALHEAYPGHHLQLVVANSLESVPRKLGSLLSPLFSEGWAFYCEELMESLGFLDRPIQKLTRLQAQLWRASRIIIDVSLHTGAMSVEEAIRFLVDRAGLEPNDARAEVRRYTQSPTQPQCYLMGKLEILKIVEEYKRRFPEASMKRMHDEMLSCGSLPPALMRLRLFGEEKVEIEKAVEKPAAHIEAATKRPVARKVAVPKKPAAKKPGAGKTAVAKKPTVKKPTKKKVAAVKRKSAPAKTAAKKPALRKAAAAKKPKLKKPAARKAAVAKKPMSKSKPAARKAAVAKKQVAKKAVRKSAKKKRS
jgi:uncharacterized protein (DUF885 family)